MRRAQSGDRDAYSTIFTRHAPRIWSMARLFLHNESSADDILQETFTQGWIHITSYRGTSEPVAWLSAIAMNACRHSVRRRPMQQTSSLESGLASGRPPAGGVIRGPLTTLMRRERTARLKVALGYLTEPQRAVVILRYVNELSYEAIAQILEMQAGAARALAHRGRATIRERMGTDELVGKDLGGMNPFDLEPVLVPGPTPFRNRAATEA
jgi:RNA polymerase sigma-70 factor (ECF subfamily)